jgi:hypothetical protein
LVQRGDAVGEAKRAAKDAAVKAKRAIKQILREIKERERILRTLGHDGGDGWRWVEPKDVENTSIKEACVQRVREVRPQLPKARRREEEARKGEDRAPANSSAAKSAE